MTRLAPFLWLSLVALVAALSVFAISPPSALPASAPSTEFSADRAMVHVRRIASAPHPMGSPAADDVAKYVVASFEALGIHADVVEGSAAVRVAGGVSSGHVRNIVARLPGTEHGKAVALSAHYDSVPQSMGASDDGAGIATLLETARALKERGAHRDDIVFLATDGEEAAVLGAQALAPKLGDIGVVLNFEARGNRGAVAMYDPADASGELVRVLGETASRPVASSFLAALAKALPNDSDVTVFKRAGIPALGFAFADGFENYHRHTDDATHLDPASLQHDGDYALAMSDALGRRNVDSIAAPDLAYFDVFARVLVRYPLWAARVLALLTLVGFGVALRRAGVSVRGVLAGAGVFFLTVLLAGGVGFGVQWFVRDLDFYRLLAMVKVTSGAALFISAAVAIAGYRLALRWIAPLSLMFGVFAVWSVALAAAATFAPALTPPLEWPLAFALAGWFARKQSLGLLPGAVLFSAVVYSVVVATGATMLAAPAIFAAFGFGLLVPLFAEKRTLLLAPPALIAGVALAVFATRWSPYLHGEPVTDSLVYGVDTDKGSACLFTHDGTSTHWTALTLHAARARQMTAFSRWNEWDYAVDAPLEPHAASEVAVLEDTTVGDARHVRARITVEKSARCVDIWDAEHAVTRATAIDGAPVQDLFRFSPERDEEILRWMTGDTSPRVFRAHHCGLNDGAIELALDGKAGAPIKLRVVAEEPALPAAVPPRTESIPSERSDVTLVSRLLTF